MYCRKRLAPALRAGRRRDRLHQGSPTGRWLEALEPRLLMATVTWAVDADGFWDVASNWSNNEVPGLDDDVVIDRAGGPFTITVRSGAQSINSLQSAERLSITGGSLTLASTSTISSDFSLSAGTLTSNGALTLSGETTWTSGTIGGSGSVINTGAFALASGNVHVLAADMTNTEPALFAHRAGAWQIEQGAVFTNEGTIEITGDVTVNVGGGDAPLIVNNGILQRHTGTGNAQINAKVDNHNVVDVDTGSLTFTSIDNSGSMHAAADASIVFVGFFSDIQMNAGTTWDGPGSYVTNSFAKVNINTGVTVSPQNLLINAFSTVQGAGNLVVPAGGVLTHGGGLDGAGTLTIESGGLMTITGSTSLYNRTLNNFGAMQLNSGTLQLAGSNVLTNKAGGTITTTGNTLFFGAGSVVNEGAITVNAPGAISDFALPVTHSGTVDVDAGVIRFSGGGTLGGPFDLVEGGVAAFIDGTFTATSDLAWNGQGTYYVGGDNGFLVLPEGFDLTVNDLHFDGSFNFNAIYGPGRVIIPDGGTFLWTGGRFEGATVILQPGSVVTVKDPNGNNPQLRDSDLENFTDIAVSDRGEISMNQGARLFNRPSGTITVAADADFFVIGGSNNADELHNEGLISIDATGSVKRILPRTSNTGIIEAVGGEVTVDATITQFTVNNDIVTLTAGTYRVHDGANLRLRTGNAFAEPRIDINQGTLEVQGSGVLQGLDNLDQNEGTLNLLDGAQLTLLDDTFTNTGTLTLGPDADLVAPGAFTQSSAGSLVALIDNTPGNDGAGQISVAGQASLDGELEVQLLNGYAPVAGDSYPILAYGSVSGDFETFTGVTPTFVTDRSNTAYTLTVDAPVEPIDLDVVSVDALVGAQSGQEVTIQYAVQNISANNLAGNASWTDSLYLSLNDTFDSGDVLIGRVTRGGPLAADAIYEAQLTALLPGVTPGQYRVVVISDSRVRLSDSDRTNNSGSSAAFSVSTPTLSLGGSVQGTIAAGQEVVYQLTLSADEAARIEADLGADGAAELAMRFLAPPSGSTYDDVVQNATGDLLQLTIPSGQTGTYYLRLRGLAAAGDGVSYTLSAAEPTLELGAVSPATVSNQGQATLTITGQALSADAVVTLVSQDSQTTRVATRVLSPDSGTLHATFDLTGLSVGSYDVRVEQDNQTLTLDAAVTVNAQTAVDALKVKLTTPASVRPSRLSTLTVDFYNDSLNDIVAPTLVLMTDNATLRAPGDGFFVPDVLELQATSASGPAGVLAPGQRGSITVSFVPDNNLLSRINFSLAVLDDSGQIDWSQLKDQLRPTSIADDAWDAIYDSFTQRVGNTAGSLQAALASQTTRLGDLGVGVSVTSDLIEAQLTQANAALPFNTLAGSLDVMYPEPGLPLKFGHWMLASIEGRYREGPLGRGWYHPYLMQLNVLDGGDVAIDLADEQRTYLLQDDTTFQSAPGDTAVLTRVGNEYLLTEPGVVEVRFDANGRLRWLEDDNGHRVTAGYTGDNLTTLTHSSGDVMTLAYNGDGRITSVTEPGGRVVTYGYDAGGEHLTSVTDERGSKVYSYLTNQAQPQREHALSMVTYADGSSTTFTYDNLGRLASQQSSNAPARVDYSYDGLGGVTYTDALGGQQTIFFDNLGRIHTIHDALGNTRQIEYDAEGRATRFDSPLGSTLWQYDDLGNITRETNPLGYAFASTWDSQTGERLTFTDARGYTTTFGLDSAGNRTSVTYADNSMESMTYDAGGALTLYTNRRGHDIAFTYDDRGLTTSRTYEGGGSVAYTYDDDGNLLTATDDAGAITMTYDGLGQMTSIVYPGGRSLTYTYDSAGRRASITDQDGFQTKYSYDSAGRLSALHDGSDAIIVSYAYDANSLLTREDRGNGTYTTYAYGSIGELLTVTHHAPDDSVNAAITYSYDSFGRISGINGPDGQSTYVYDALSQLIEAHLPGNRVITYAYDANGNRLSVTDTGVTSDYTTNNLNQVTAAGSVTYTYDADGNILTRTDNSGTTDYVYDDEHRLISVSNDTDTWTYTYDGLDRRATATHNGVTTTYLWDPSGMGRLIGEFDQNGNAIARYTHGAGLVSQLDGNDASYYYDFGVAGSTLGVTNAAGEYVNRYSYTPFGEVTTLEAGVRNPFTFVGQFGVMQDEHGLFHMRQREYSPEIGAFVSDDPRGLDGGDTHIRRYALNSPLMVIDPRGLENVSPGGIILPNAPNPPAEILIPTTGNDGIPLSQAMESRPDVRGAMARDTSAGRALGKQLADNAKRLKDIADWEKANKLGDKVLPYLDFGYRCGRILVDPKTKYRRIKLVPDDQYIPPLCQVFPELCKYEDFSGINIVRPSDPNDIIGPAGVGDLFAIAPDITLPYMIRFENMANASAPAQEVFVTQTLDSDLDWSTFELVSFGFGQKIIDIPTGLSSYTTRVDDTDVSGLFVDVTVDFDAGTGELSWTFSSVDPDTGDLPADALAGFLPPNVTGPQGEGFVSYRVLAKPGNTDGTRIDAVARIVFDTENPIDTPPIFNTIDTAPPSSSVTALPAQNSGANIAVAWTGSDTVAGVATYDLFVSVDGGDFELWLDDTEDTSATYAGEVGKTYAFYSVATDALGLEESAPLAADATTTTVPGTGVQTGDGVGKSIVWTDADGTVITLSVKGAVADAQFSGDNVQTSTAKGVTTVTGSNLVLTDLTVTGATDASITIKTKGGDGRATLGNLAVDGSVKALTGKTLDVTGNVEVDGDLAKSDLGGFTSGGQTFVVLGAGPISSLRFTNVMDLQLTSAAAIKSLQVAQWTSTAADTPNSIAAPSIGKLTSAGDFAADVTLTDAGAALSLNSLTIKGAMANAVLRAASSVKKVTADRFNAVSLLVGLDDDVEGLPTLAGDFVNQQAALGSVSAKSKTQPGYVASVAAAWSIGKAALGLIDTDNDGETFGVSGNAIKSLTATVPDNGSVRRISLPRDPGGNPVIDEGDFEVHLV
jgi:RHS repeat-associated protein